jgi:hypothetical protein
MKKSILNIAIGLTIASVANAQLKVQSTGDVVLPQGTTVKSSDGSLYLQGSNKVFFGCDASSNNPNWAIQYWGGGLNFWKPSGSTNAGDYKLFLKDDGTVGIGDIPTTSDKLSVFGSTKLLGNVGIGGNSTADKLSVYGNTHIYGEVVQGKSTWHAWTDVYLDWLAPNGMPTLYPQTNGNLTIGTGSNRVYMQAIQVWSTWFTTTSDERVKENIVSLQSSLQKIKRLRAVQYNIKKEYVSDNAMKSKSDLRKSNIGFLAQDVQKVFPDLVTQSDSAGLYGINYMEFIPIIIDAMKEQSKTIDSLKAQTSAMDSLKAQLAVLTNQVGVLQNCCTSNKGGGKTKSDLVNDAETLNQSTSNTTMQTSAAKLYQNAPNPFKESTTIKLEIPETVGNAMVCIYDLNGRQLKCLTVSGRGNTSVQIFGNELTAGLYHYALIADGSLVDTKTMVLTE